MNDILQRLEGTYGTVVSDAALLQKFYAEKQREGENVAAWAGCLEDIIAQLRQRGKVATNSSEEMIRNKFWVGLRMDDLKNATRHKFDDQASYLDLLGYARSVEQELAECKAPKPKVARINQESVGNPEVDVAAVASAAAVKAVQPMMDRMETFIERQAQQSGPWNRQHNNSAGTEGRQRSGNGQQWQGQRSGPPPWNRQPNGPAGPEGHQPSGDGQQPQRPPQGCFRCGGLDYYKRGCRATLPENGQFPLSESWQQGELQQTPRD